MSGAATPGERLLFAAWRIAALLRHPRLHWKYLRRTRRVPDLAWPCRFSERMLWRKLFDRNPLFVTFADRLAAKAWLGDAAPGLPTARVLRVGQDPAGLPDALLRPGVALKCSHGSDTNILCRDAAPPRDEAVARLRRWLARDGAVR
jgi:hypothetical protein